MRVTSPLLISSTAWGVKDRGDDPRLVGMLSRLVDTQSQNSDTESLGQTPGVHSPIGESCRKERSTNRRGREETVGQARQGASQAVDEGFEAWDTAQREAQQAFEKLQKGIASASEQLAEKLGSDAE